MVTVDVAPRQWQTLTSQLFIWPPNRAPGYFTYICTTSSPARVLELVHVDAQLIEAWHRLFGAGRQICVSKGAVAQA